MNSTLIDHDGKFHDRCSALKPCSMKRLATAAASDRVPVSGMPSAVPPEA